MRGSKRTAHLTVSRDGVGKTKETSRPRRLKGSHCSDCAGFLSVEKNSCGSLLLIHVATGLKRALIPQRRTLARFEVQR